MRLPKKSSDFLHRVSLYWQHKFLQVNGYISRGNNFAIFICVSGLNGEQLIKDRVCSLRIRVYPLTDYSSMKVFFLPGKQRGNQKNMISLYETG